MKKLSEWAWNEALKRSNETYLSAVPEGTPFFDKEGAFKFKPEHQSQLPTLWALALCIEQHEQPPVDPLLLRAREAVAKAYELLPIGSNSTKSSLKFVALQTREGIYDNSHAVQACLNILQENK